AGVPVAAIAARVARAATARAAAVPAATPVRAAVHAAVEPEAGSRPRKNAPPGAVFLWGATRAEAARPGSAARDHELAEADAQVPAFAGTGQGQRDVALGHHLRIARLDRAGVHFGAAVGADQVVEAVGAGELALAVDDL